MTASFTVTPTVNDPIAVIGDMLLACDRLYHMLSTANSVLMEDVVEHAPKDHPSYRVWCTFHTAIEKIREIGLILDKADTQLRGSTQVEG